MSIYTLFTVKFYLNKYISFIWGSNNRIKPIINFQSLNYDLLSGIERQKKTLLENTNNFAKGNFTNNALLWGSRGNGKSSLIKSLFIKLSLEFDNLRLIQLNKENIKLISNIYDFAKKNNKYRFIIFIDDLSFEKIDNEYKIIKSTLDGSLQYQPKNIILYVTSNRRHLMPRDMIDNERSSAIHTDESVEEKISLSDRFGLWIGFHNLSQDDYLNIIKKYSNYYNIPLEEKELQDSIKWSLQRGNRTGRTAWQYVIEIAAKKNLKISF
ncbi:MAG: hypothetical protein CFH18_00106 [Alphaproteobacteria bacterium MarineAlpha5_Bin8]|nr:MAG: hypothetical protein CFH17_00764 [Alphaproteobacteria bacterium MarineAlpha5_Bin7]PPR48296.1 MAG: hypothetical protein CFH18_00106 [Alphaproteobacteria bacterium MarineAlpha5_Bin8]|tara:strand:- start:14272 stop:15075 length:804 start_codon:yes stop_codon:yes gene_type:complete